MEPEEELKGNTMDSHQASAQQVRKTESAVAESTEQVQAARSTGERQPSQNCKDTKRKVQKLWDPKG